MCRKVKNVPVTLFFAAVCLPSLQNEGYQYPDVMVCPYKGFGCDQQKDEGNCVYSSNTTHGETKGTFNPGLDEELDIDLLADMTEENVVDVSCHIGLASPSF